MSEVLKVEPRTALGKRNARRLRDAGMVPVVLYGHGEQNLSLAAAADQVKAVIRHGARVVDLTGAVSEKAFIRELQWDVYGLDVLHIDFTRVSAGEKVEVTLTVELRGEAPGVKDGGVVNQLVHEIDAECLVTSVPDKLHLSINDLKLGDEFTAARIDLPSGVTLLSDQDQVIVECTQPKAEAEEEISSEGAEPELIGRKAEEEEEE
jgi:large subunit ribosomal protein L25